MADYSKLTVGELLDAFASNEPIPGGGSAAALAGALGVSLLLMVAGLPKTRTGSPDERTALDAAAARLRPIRHTLTSLIDRDSDAYKSVMAAYRLPKSTDAEKASRSAAIAHAMREATDSPLDTLRACREALKDASAVIGNGIASASSDAAVAVELLTAAARGAALNVDTNLDSLKDQDYVMRVREERNALYPGS